MFSSFLRYPVTLSENCKLVCWLSSRHPDILLIYNVVVFFGMFSGFRRSVVAFERYFKICIRQFLSLHGIWSMCFTVEVT